MNDPRVQSEYDASEKVSDDVDEEYEVISAPIRRNNHDISKPVLRKPSSGYKLSRQTDKMSIDSMTELSSPFDEGSSSTKTLNTNKDDDENTMNNNVYKRKTNNLTKSQGKTQFATKGDSSAQ